MKVRIESRPDGFSWMDAYTGRHVEVLATKKTEKDVTAVQVATVDGPTWYAAKNLRRVEEDAA